MKVKKRSLAERRRAMIETLYPARDNAKVAPGDNAAVREAEAALRQAEAQLKITRILVQLDPEKRGAVIKAVTHLLEADAAVPGVFDTFVRGSGKQEPAAAPESGQLPEVH